VVVYGAGGHGRVVAEAAIQGGFEVLGFLDDALDAGTAVGELSVLGSAGWLAGRANVQVALGIGDNLVRQRVSAAFGHDGVELATVVHPRAVVSPRAALGEGSVVLALAVVNTGARVGRGAIVNSAAVVEHDVEVGDFAHVSPNATLGGGARLGALSQLGLGACVLPRKSIGSRSTVGAGAVVTRDVADCAVVTGVPARLLRRDQG
jgi:UDP-N-acetylbacillosamine N-acetyltransferase